MIVERQGDQSYPTNSISKEDLIYSRPDLEPKIEELSNEVLRQIAYRVGEIIKDEYWSAMETVLSRMFGNEGDDDSEVEPDDVPPL